MGDSWLDSQQMAGVTILYISWTNDWIWKEQTLIESTRQTESKARPTSQKRWWFSNLRWARSNKNGRLTSACWSTMHWIFITQYEMAHSPFDIQEKIPNHAQSMRHSAFGAFLFSAVPKKGKPYLSAKVGQICPPSLQNHPYKPLR